jgi:hypothetical protein
MKGWTYLKETFEGLGCRDPKRNGMDWTPNELGAFVIPEVSAPETFDEATAVSVIDTPVETKNTKTTGNQKLAMILALLIIGGISLTALASCDNGNSPSGNPGTEQPGGEKEGEKEDEKPTLGGTVSIDGIAKVGQTLTANTSAITGAKGDAAHQWKRGETILGTNSTYEVVLADLNDVITLTITFSGSNGQISKQTLSVVAADKTAEEIYNELTDLGNGNLSITNQTANPNWTYKQWVENTISAYNLITVSGASKQNQHFAAKIAGLGQLQLQLKTLGGADTALVAAGKIQFNADTLASANSAQLQQALRLGVIGLLNGIDVYANLGDATIRIEDHTQDPEIATAAATTTLSDKIVAEHTGIKNATTGLDSWYKTVLTGLPALKVLVKNDSATIPAWNDGENVIFNSATAAANVKSGLLEVIHQQGAYKDIPELADLAKFRPDVQVATKTVVALYAYLSANGKLSTGTNTIVRGNNTYKAGDTMDNLSYDAGWAERVLFLIPKFINGTAVNGKKPLTNDEIDALFLATQGFKFSSYNFAEGAGTQNWLKGVMSTKPFQYVNDHSTPDFELKKSQWDSAPIS